MVLKNVIHVVVVILDDDDFFTAMTQRRKGVLMEIKGLKVEPSSHVD